jgi:hypothetical protein
VIVAGGSTLIATVLGVPAAWAVLALPHPGKKDQLFFILSTRFMPPVVVVHPGLPDVPRPRPAGHAAGPDPRLLGFNLPFTIWMMKGFIDEVPAEYEEAAMLDGYSRFEAFLARDDAAAAPGHRRHRGVRADLLVERVRVLDLPDHRSRHAHGAVGDRGPDRRHDDRLGAWSPRRRWSSRSRCCVFAFLVRKHLVAA